MFTVRFFSVIFLFALPGSAFAAGVHGTVKDETGVPIANAEVLVLTSQRAVVATARTGTDGGFHMPAIGTGSYLVVVRAAAFGEQQMAALVTSDGLLRLDVVLTVAPIAETVTVTAVPGQVLDERHAAQAVNVISLREIELRVRTSLAEAVDEEPGVNLQRTSPTMAGVFIRGLTGNKVNVFLDGIRYSNGAQRGGVNTFFDLVDPTALETIEVLRGPNSAEYGSDALGGSIQLLGRMPTLSPDGETRVGGHLSVSGGTAHRHAGTNLLGSLSRRQFALYANLAGQNVRELRPGKGLDSHSAVTRFLGLPSTLLLPKRLPQTGFTQWSGTLKANWTPSASTQVVSSYMETRQDGGKRWDQLLGGDGNLIADLNDLKLNLFYVRVERMMSRWFEHASLTYSFNSQREERVNQGGNGNPAATIAHEPERTTAAGVHGSLFRQRSARQSVRVGGEMYFEELTSAAFNVNPVTGATSPRRPRVPSGAMYRNGGVFAQTTFDAIPEHVRLVSAIRWGGARYRARASDAPLVDGMRLWPDDDLSAQSVTFRAGAVITPTDQWSLSTGVSRGYRAPHMTDLGTLGLTGSGFEVAFPDVARLGGTVGSTATANAVSTGDEVEQVRPESSMSWDATVRYRRSRARGELSIFVNNIHDTLEKQALILPPGAVGTRIGGEIITQQAANGVVFVAATPVPVLVRDNFGNARVWGIEAAAEIPLLRTVVFNLAYTYTRTRDTATHLPPNIEGGTPAPSAYLMLRYSHPRGRWWIQPHLRVAADQPNLSTLDLGDRRTGAERSRTSIRNFLVNGATARGWVATGADGVAGTADDVLSVTGETLGQIQNRVLGAANSAPLFSKVDGYVTIGVRGGLALGRHQVLVDADNLTDENYRGISWGMDAPGVGLAVRYVLRF